MNIVLIFVGLTLLGNLFISTFIIQRTLRKLIIPELEKNSCELIKIKRIWFFNTGHFKDNSVVFRPANLSGNYKFAIYRFLYFKDKSKNERIVTVKISWNLFRKTKIEIKPNI